MASYPNKQYPTDHDNLWEHFEKMGAYKKEQLAEYIGLPDVDAVATSINYFFSFPQMFQKELPQLFERYKRIFNQDPTLPESPIIHPVDYTQF